MKGRWLLALCAANLVVLVGLVFAFPRFMVAPGPLGKGHTHLEADCFACHVPFRTAQAESCVACHALADIGVRTTKGSPVLPGKLKTTFHASLLENDCMHCHVAHRVPPLSRREHPAFTHDMLAAKARDRCESCHAPPEDELHDKIEGGCAQCHLATHWKPSAFDHDKYFKLDRRHNKSCSRCHVDNDFEQYTCYGCHAHKRRSIIAEHREEGITDIEDCAACHPDSREEHARESPRDGRPEED